MMVQILPREDGGVLRAIQIPQTTPPAFTGLITAPLTSVLPSPPPRSSPLPAQISASVRSKLAGKAKVGGKSRQQDNRTAGFRRPWARKFRAGTGGAEGGLRPVWWYWVVSKRNILGFTLEQTGQRWRTEAGGGR
eukprot:3316402-Rhodomonas_salina.1